MNLPSVSCHISCQGKNLCHKFLQNMTSCQNAYLNVVFCILTGAIAVYLYETEENVCIHRIHTCMQILSTSNAANLPAAIRAAFAKFPVSMQAINSLLSSTVFLRTKAGFPFPHFGRLRIVLKKKQKNTDSVESALETKHLVPVLVCSGPKCLESKLIEEI